MSASMLTGALLKARPLIWSLLLILQMDPAVAGHVHVGLQRNQGPIQVMPMMPLNHVNQ